MPRTRYLVHRHDEVLGWHRPRSLIGKVSDASRTLFLNIRTRVRPCPCADFRHTGIGSFASRLVSTRELYGYLAYGPLKGVPPGDLVGNQQGALISNKCLTQGDTKCPSSYGAGAFKLSLFCTGTKIVCINHGLLSTVRKSRHGPS